MCRTRVFLGIAICGGQRAWLILRGIARQFVLQAKEPVATAGLRLAREQSLTVRLLILLTIANTPPTTVLWLPSCVTSSPYTTCLLPYRPANTFRLPIVAAPLTPACGSASHLHLMIAVSLPCWACNKSTSPLFGHCNCNDVVLPSSQTSSSILLKSSCLDHDGCTIVTPSRRLPNEASS